MPHVIVKMWPGKSKAKKRMPRRSRARYLDTSYGAAAVSVGIEEVDSQHWIDKVYNPEITGK